MIGSEDAGVKDVGLNGCSIVFLALEARECALLDFVESGLRKGRALSHLCAEGEEVFSVLTEAAGADAGSACAEARSDKVDLLVEGLFGVGLGALAEEVAEQANCSGFIALEYLAHVHGEAEAESGKLVILHQKDGQTVLQLKLLVLSNRRSARGCGGRANAAVDLGAGGYRSYERQGN